MIRDNKIYAEYDEQYCKGSIFYLKSTEVFCDKECTKLAKKEGFAELFLDGIILCDLNGSGEYYRPCGYNPETGLLTYITTEGTTLSRSIKPSIQ